MVTHLVEFKFSQLRPVLLRVMFSLALATLSRPIRTSASFGSFVNRTFSTSPLVQAARVKKYKLKTHHGAAKRWKALASGMFKRVNIPLSYLANRTADASNGNIYLLKRKEGRSHFNVKKSPSNLNNLGQAAYANIWQSRHLRRLLPYA